MIKEKTWEEFRESGMLWWINQALQVFGWSIVFETNGHSVRVYPARTKIRGFGEEENTEGYRKVSEFMKENAEVLEEEANE